MATYPVTYLGWYIFPDSGRVYRSWRVNEDLEAIEAKLGDLLMDLGPRLEGKRLTLRGASRFWTLEDVEGALGWRLPSWRPPREADLKIAGALEKLADRVDFASQATKALDQIRQVVQQTRQATLSPKKSQRTTTGPANRLLRLKFEGQYNDGDPYKDFELLVDVPEIPVTRTSDVRPRYAIKGDVLRERYEDELTPFQLRRNGRRIGDPEWWQVRHLFVGLRENAPEGHDDDEEKETSQPPSLTYLRSLVSSPVYNTTGAREFDPGAHRVALMATEDVPGTPIQRHDIILVCWGTGNREPRQIRGRQIRVPRSALATVADHFDSLAVLEVARSDHWTYDVDELREKLRIPQRSNWKDSTSPLLIVRPLVAPVSEPVAAESDDAALFELLAQVGCKMPTSEA